MSGDDGLTCVYFAPYFWKILIFDEGQGERVERVQTWVIDQLL